MAEESRLVSKEEAAETIQRLTAAGAIVLGLEGCWVSTAEVRPDLGYIADLSGSPMNPGDSAAEALQILSDWPQDDRFRVELVIDRDV